MQVKENTTEQMHMNLESSGKKALKAGIGYTLGNYLLKGLSFLTLPLFTRLLTTSDYGRFSVFLSYEAVLSIILGLAIHSSYKNAKLKYKGAKYNDYIASSIFLIIINTLLIFIIVNVFAVPLSNFLELNRVSINILVLYSYAGAILACFNSYIVLEYRYKSYLFISALNALGNIILSVLLIVFVFDHNRYYGRLIGNFLPLFIISIVLTILLLKNGSIKNVKSYWKWGIFYSLPIIPHGLSQIILSQFDRIMILKMIGSREAGIYSFSYICFSLVAVTTSSLDGAWTPWFYEQMEKRNFETIKKKSSIYMLFMFMFFSTVILICPEIIKIAGSSEYWEAVYCVIPLVAGGFFSFLYNFPAGVEYYHEKTKFIMVGTLCAALINIVLNYIFISHNGYIAAAYTTLTTYILYFLFHYGLAKKIQGSSLFSSKLILVLALGVLCISFISFFFLSKAFIRWLLALLEIGAFIFIEEMKLGYIYARVKKFRRK